MIMRCNSFEKEEKHSFGKKKRKTSATRLHIENVHTRLFIIVRFLSLVFCLDFYGYISLYTFTNIPVCIPNVMLKIKILKKLMNRL